jgi:hypothetical protein
LSLHHLGNVSQPALHTLLTHAGIQIAPSCQGRLRIPHFAAGKFPTLKYLQASYVLCDSCLTSFVCGGLPSGAEAAG